MADCQLFGLNAGMHHSVNVLFHAANSLLLLLLLLRWTNALWPSAFAAALFAWHPLHVESVAWISERKDVLSTFFALLALLAYTKAVTSDEWRVTRKNQFPVTRHPSLVTLLLARLAFLRAGLDGQADGGDAAVRDVAAGLLAAERIRNSEFGIRNFTKLLLEKMPVLRAGGGFLCHHVSGPASRRRGGFAADRSAGLPPGKRAGGLCALSAAK